MGRPKRLEDDELLAVARRAFVERGFAASTRVIARRARISEAVIYQRYPTKTHLFFAAMVPPAADVEAVLAAPTAARSARTHLEEIAVGMFRYLRRVAPVFLPLFAHPDFDFETFARNHPDNAVHRMQRGLVGFLEAQQTRGRVGSCDAAAAATTLFAALHWLAVLEHVGMHGSRRPDEVVRDIVGALWAGLAPRGART